MRVYPDAVLQWEDFLKANAITQLARFRDRLCTFNDDIQGTAAVVVAGVYAALRITGRRCATSASCSPAPARPRRGLPTCSCRRCATTGCPHEEARQRICTVDSRGLVTQARPDLEDFKAAYARPVEEVASYACRDPRAHHARGNHPQLPADDSHRHVGHGRACSRRRSSARWPPSTTGRSCSRCRTRRARASARRSRRFEWSDGRAIVATGSPFEPVVHRGRTLPHRPGQQRVRLSGRRTGSVGRAACAASPTPCSSTPPGRWRSMVTAADLRSGRGLSRAHAHPRLLARRGVRRDPPRRRRRPRAPGMLADLEETVRSAMWFPKYPPVRHRRRFRISTLNHERKSASPHVMPTPSFSRTTRALASGAWKGVRMSRHSSNDRRRDQTP